MKPDSPNRLLKIWRFFTILYFCFTLYALLLPTHRVHEQSLPVFSHVHAAAFALLGFCVEIGRVQRPFYIIFILLLLYGPFTELGQWVGNHYFNTGRFFEWMDILEDTVGIVTGTGLGLLLRRICPFNLLYGQRCDALGKNSEKNIENKK